MIHQIDYEKMPLEMYVAALWTYDQKTNSNKEEEFWKS